jgi:MFS family permease
LYYAYAVLAPEMAAALGTTPRVIALAFSGALVVAGLSAWLVGRRLDRLGARPVLLAGALLGPLALLVLAVSPDAPSLVLGFVLLGIAHALALYEPAFQAVVGWFPNEDRRRRGLLLVTTVGGFASTVFVPLVAALVLGHGWRHATAILAGVLAAVALPTALLLPDPLGATHSTAPSSPLPDVVGPSRGTRRLRLAFGLHAFVSTAVTVSLVWHLVESGMPVMRAAFVTGLLGAAQVPGRLLLAPLQTVLADGWRLPINFCVQACALLLVALGGGALQIAGVIVLGALSGAMTLERAVVTVRWYGVRRFGAASGALAAGGLIGRALAPFTIELLRGAVGYDVALAGTALLLAGAGLAFATADRDRYAVPSTVALGPFGQATPASSHRSSRGRAGPDR